MISNVNSSQLLKVAREGSAQEFAHALRETGQAILANSIETFCQMDRESQQGLASVQQLKDLKNSIIASLERDTQGRAANLAAGENLREATAQGTHPQHKLEGTKVEVVNNVASLAYKGGTVYETLQRTFKPESAVLHNPTVDEMKGVKAFLADLNSVMGLYTAAVMIPGPLALSVKNFAKEVADGHFQASSTASGVSASRGFLRRSSSAFSEVSEAEGTQHYEKTTVDERVVPVLTELQDRLAQVSVVPASEASLSADRHFEEHQGKKNWILPGMNFENRISHSYYESERLRRPLEKVPFQPEHIRLPETSISDFK